MSDALSLAISTSLAAALPSLGLPSTPIPAPAPANHVNINGPAFISPAITFDPVTDVVIFTYRNAQTGKVTEQVPPNAVVSRYRAVDETGIPNPTLPLSTPKQLVAATTPSPSGNSDSPPPPAPTTGSSGNTTTTTSSTIA